MNNNLTTPFVSGITRSWGNALVMFPVGIFRSPTDHTKVSSFGFCDEIVDFFKFLENIWDYNVMNGIVTKVDLATSVNLVNNIFKLGYTGVGAYRITANRILNKLRSALSFNTMISPAVDTVEVTDEGSLDDSDENFTEWALKYINTLEKYPD